MSDTAGKKSRIDFLTILKFCVVAGAITYLIKSGNLNKDDLKRISQTLPQWMAAGILVLLSLMAVSFVRYWILLKGVGIRLTLWETVRIGFIGTFFNTFMVGGLGGDVIKLAYVIRETDNKAGAVASVMVDRILGLLGLMLIGGIALFLSWDDVLKNPDLHNICLGVFGILGCALLSSMAGGIALAKGRIVGLAVWGGLTVIVGIFCYCALRENSLAFTFAEPSTPALLRGRALLILAANLIISLICVILLPSCQPGRSFAKFVRNRMPLGSKLMGLVDSLLAYRNEFKIVSLAFGLSIFLQGLCLVVLYLFSLSMEMNPAPTFSHICFAGPPAMVANALPISPGGLGVGEAAFGSLLSKCVSSSGVNITGGAALFLLFRFWVIVVGLIGLPLYLKGKKEIEEAKEEYLTQNCQETSRDSDSGSSASIQAQESSTSS